MKVLLEFRNQKLASTIIICKYCSLATNMGYFPNFKAVDTKDASLYFFHQLKPNYSYFID